MPHPVYSDALWAAMRDEYETVPGVSILGLHKRFGPSRPIISKRIVEDGWSKAAPEPIEEATFNKLHGIRSEDDVAAAIERASDHRAALITEHQGEWIEIDLLRKEAMLAFSSPGFRPVDAPTDWGSTDRLVHAQRLIASYNTAAMALATKQEGQRRAHGFDYKSQQRKIEDDREKTASRASLIASIMEKADALERKIGEGDAAEPSI